MNRTVHVDFSPLDIKILKLQETIGKLDYSIIKAPTVDISNDLKKYQDGCKIELNELLELQRKEMGYRYELNESKTQVTGECNEAQIREHVVVYEMLKRGYVITWFESFYDLPGKYYFKADIEETKCFKYIPKD